MAQLTTQHWNYVRKLSRAAPSDNPLLNPAAYQKIVKADPSMAGHLAAIASNPVASMQATNGQSTTTIPGGPGGSAGSSPTQQSFTDPSGVTNPNRAVDYASYATKRRQSNMRHQLLGFTTAALTSGGANQTVKATPQVAFKAERLVVAPTVVSAGGSIGQLLVGTKNQSAGNTLEPFDVYQPASYAGEIDFDICDPAVAVSALVNTTAAVQFYAGLLGLVQGKQIDPLHTKIQGFGLGITSIAAGSTVTIAVNPQIDFVPRKIALTPGAGYSDNLIISSIQCGMLLQLASADPIPASMFSDVYHNMFLDFDVIGAAVALQFQVTNLNATAATIFQGTVRGDCNPAQVGGGNARFQ